MKTIKVLTTKRDMAILNFLWRWKVATTAALAKKFFPERTGRTAYNRLWLLKRSGFIEIRSDVWQQKFVWSLTNKGYTAVREALPTLRADGFRSESIGHDLLVSAVHLGEWLLCSPENAQLFSEQQLRRLHFDSYPSWVPKTDLHRPDGYWRIKNGENFLTIALEVELSQKTGNQYEIVGDFYSKHPSINHVIWVVPRLSLAGYIHTRIQKAIRQKTMIHSFIVYADFQQQSWNAPIVCGAFLGKTIAQILGANIGNSPEPVLGSFLLNTRKSPFKAKTSTLFSPGDFSDRLGSNPSSSPS